MITDKNCLKTDKRWSKHSIIVSFLRQMYGLRKYSLLDELKMTIWSIHNRLITTWTYLTKMCASEATIMNWNVQGIHTFFQFSIKTFFICVLLQIWGYYSFRLTYRITCSWHQKTNSPIIQFSNLKCCIKSKEPFKTSF